MTTKRTTVIHFYYRSCCAAFRGARKSETQNNKAVCECCQPRVFTQCEVSRFSKLLPWSWAGTEWETWSSARFLQTGRWVKASGVTRQNAFSSIRNPITSNCLRSSSQPAVKLFCHDGGHTHPHISIFLRTLIDTLASSVSPSLCQSVLFFSLSLSLWDAFQRLLLKRLAPRRPGAQLCSVRLSEGTFYSMFLTFHFSESLISAVFILIDATRTPSTNKDKTLSHSFQRLKIFVRVRFFLSFLSRSSVSVGRNQVVKL